MAKRRRARSNSTPTTPAAAASPPPPATIFGEHDWLRLPWPLEWIALSILLITTLAFSVLEMHSSTDTWIGLVAGRQIVEQGEFPVTDHMSYTFYGQKWFNQNWLSHAYLWVLYDWFSPNFVIYGTWLIAAAMSVFVGLAGRLHTRSWFAAAFVCAVTAFASRDWLSARPATVQFFLLALFWLGLTGFRTQREGEQRIWPLVVLIGVLLVWPHAHGSFIFGYMLLFMFLGFGLGPWLLGQPGFLTLRQGMILVAMMLATLILSIALSPFGVDNLLHPLVVAESEVFRQVGEWQPPYRTASWPPVERFWWLLGSAAVLPLLLALVALVDLGLGRGPLSAALDATGPPRARSQPDQPGEFRLWTSLGGIGFDVAGLLLGFAMAMFARRFAPMLFIFGAPVVVKWLIILARTMLHEQTRALLRLALLLVALVGGIWVGSFSYHTAKRALVEKPPEFDQFEFDLLDRVTYNYRTPRFAMEFFNRNDLDPNVWTEWTQGGPIAFNCPQVKVFIDGRAQQVYDEKHYLTYTWMISAAHTNIPATETILDNSGTDAVLLRGGGPMREAMTESDKWQLMFASPISLLYVRQGGEFMQTLVRREIAGDLWWPDIPETNAIRGQLLAIHAPGQADRAVELGLRATRANPSLGIDCYPWMTRALLVAGRPGDARTLLDAQREWIQNLLKDVYGDAAPSQLSPARRAEISKNLPREHLLRCLKTIDECQRVVDQARLR